MSVCISSISVLLNSFFGPSCFPLSNIMSQSSCCSLVYLRAAQQSCSSKLCFISGGQGGPTAKMASQALPVGLKLHALLCCVYKDIPILIDPFFYVHFVRTLYLDHFFGFYLSVKASKNAGFFSYRPLCVFTCFCIYQSICGDCAKCPGTCDWHACQPMAAREGPHSPRLAHGRAAVAALTEPCLTQSHHQLQQTGPPKKYTPLPLFYSARFIYFWLCLFCFLKILYLAMLGLSCSMWGLVPWPGIKPGPPALGVWSLSHWTTREVPPSLLSKWWYWESPGWAE